VRSLSKTATIWQQEPDFSCSSIRRSISSRPSIPGAPPYPARPGVSTPLVNSLSYTVRPLSPRCSASSDYRSGVAGSRCTSGKAAVDAKPLVHLDPL